MLERYILAATAHDGSQHVPPPHTHTRTNIVAVLFDAADKLGDAFHGVALLLIDGKTHQKKGDTGNNEPHRGDDEDAVTAAALIVGSAVATRPTTPPHHCHQREHDRHDGDGQRARDGHILGVLDGGIKFCSMRERVAMGRVGTR